jgi:hypothetical protein
MIGALAAPCRALSARLCAPFNVAHRRRFLVEWEAWLRLVRNAA